MSLFQHYELNTSDPDAAKKFYAAVFGWKFDDVSMGGGATYTMIVGEQGPFGGMQRKPRETVPDHWLGYITVADIDKAIAKVKKAGGSLEAGIIEIPGMGKYALFLDPTGSAFAAWEQLAPPPAPAAKKATKKKATKKKAAKKKAAKKKAAPKKAAKKKKATKKKATKKKATKKAAKKKAAPKKAAKKKAAKKAAPKKAAKKKAAKKTAKKKAGKKK